MMREGSRTFFKVITNINWFNTLFLNHFTGRIKSLLKYVSIILLSSISEVAGVESVTDLLTDL